jgi:glycine/D-amino acid oxidase-like deaminating enzyme
MRIGIVGAGIFGIAAAIALRARGHDVTVFEQGTVPNERASSTDVSKTIRRFYGDSPTYVELAERSARQWRTWQERLGERFYFQIGQLQIQQRFEPGMRIHDSWQYFQSRDPSVRVLPVAEARQRFPQFSYRDEDVCVWDPWAGYVASGQAVAALARLARAEGVIIRESTPVRSVGESATGAEVVVDGGAASFDRVVVAAGVWLSQLVPEVGRHLTPTFQQMAFFEPPAGGQYAPGPLPVWTIEVEVEGWYGHPLQREGWVKVSNDLRGAVVDADVSRQATPEFLDAAREFVGRRIPGLAAARLAGSRACLYENSPDHDFLIDWAPGSQRVLVAGGGSGHGFKFGGSIGDVIADAVEDRANPLGELFRLGQRLAKL